MSEETLVQEEAKPKKAYGRHSHSPNFGRYVEGCLVCEAKKAAGGFERKVEKPRARQVHVTVEQNQNPDMVTISKAQLQELMERKSNGDLDQASLAEALIGMVKEMKKPDAEVTEAKELAARKREQQRMRAIEAAEVQRQSRENIEAACESMGHKKDEGRSTKSAIVQGQVYSDGMVRPFCLTCGKQFKAYKASMEQMTS